MVKAGKQFDITILKINSWVMLYSTQTTLLHCLRDILYVPRASERLDGSCSFEVDIHAVHFH